MQEGRNVEKKNQKTMVIDLKKKKPTSSIITLLIKAQPGNVIPPPGEKKKNNRMKTSVHEFNLAMLVCRECHCKRQYQRQEGWLSCGNKARIESMLHHCTGPVPLSLKGASNRIQSLYMVDISIVLLLLDQPLHDAFITEDKLSKALYHAQTLVPEIFNSLLYQILVVPLYPITINIVTACR